MKIGILTHHYINNFGAFLQAYALCGVVKEMFPEDQVEIIDFVNVKHFFINAGGWLRFYKERENLKCWLQKIKLIKTFANARNTEMELSQRCFTAKQVNKLEYDCILVGSDEVWNFKDNKSNCRIKFGVGLNCKRLIAYAPSVGKTTVEEKLPKYVEQGIKKFQAISVRDDLTSELIRNIIDKKPDKVLDPTFLYQFPRLKRKENYKPYILFYYCENLPPKILKQILLHAKENNLAVYGAGECDKRYTEITVNLTPFEWVEMFCNAEFVFTGTFHGVVFSILNRRPFKVYLTNESRMKKVGALLKEFEIQDREIDSGFDFNLNIMRNEINYEKVFRIINDRCEKSRQFLMDNIK